MFIVDNPELKWLDVQVHDFEGSEDTVTIKIVVCFSLSWSEIGLKLRDENSNLYF